MPPDGRCQQFNDCKRGWFFLRFAYFCFSSRKEKVQKQALLQPRICRRRVLTWTTKSGILSHHPFGTLTGLIGPPTSAPRIRGFLFPCLPENDMERVVAFVDGFNLYHSLEENPAYRKYKWLNIRSLVETYVPPKDLREVYYFTALTTWRLEKLERHKTLIKVLESTGVQVVYGEFRKRDRTCPNCRRMYSSHEEKQTDVNIAIHLFRLAIQDRYDTALIVSGDSDLIPSIKAVKSTFPSKRIGVLIPISRRAEELKQHCDFHIKIREKNLVPCMFPNPVILSDGARVPKPSTW